MIELTENPRIDIIGTYMKVSNEMTIKEQQILDVMHDGWMVYREIAKELPDVNLQTVRNNLLRLQARGLVECTLPVHGKLNGKKFYNLKLWRKKP